MEKYSNETGYPSVTNIIDPWLDKRWFKDEHRRRGDHVHQRVAAHINYDFLPDYDTQYDVYFRSFLKFEPRIQKVVLSEERMACDELRFCGQPDIIFIDADGLLTLGDWKTSVAIAKYWPIQLGGYSILLKNTKGISVEKCMIIRLRREEDKNPLINDYDVNECERLFRNQLELYNIFKR